jgi:large subunit ribosomal protein L25
LHELITREVEIECLPDDIPEHFTLDASELSIGEALRASQIPMAGSMKLLSNPEAVISHVVSMKAEEVVAPDAAAVAPAAAEPEVAKVKGKKEEEAAPADDKKKKK